MGHNHSQKTWRQRTNLVRAGLARSGNRETSEALYMSSGHIYDSAEQAEAAFAGEADNFVYARYGNPTVQMLEDRLAALEGAEACRATGSGMAAIFASMACMLESGDRVVASRALFGACYSILTKILPRWGVETILVDGRDLDAWEAALSKPTKIVFLESPSNPLLHLVDIAAVAEMAHQAGAKMIVDNVFATPLYQSPLELGADIVVYSATKHIDGQGRLLAGAVLGDTDYMDEIFLPFYRQTGPAISAFNAWVMTKSLETLSLRVDAQSQTATELASYLSDHDAVSAVQFPGHETHPQFELAQKQMSGPGSLLAFELSGGKASAFAFLNALKLIDISNNLGDSKSLACHPASTTHSNLSDAERTSVEINDGHIRLSVGLEDSEDLLMDLEQALAQANLQSGSA